jgi:hypothetical protein
MGGNHRGYPLRRKAVARNRLPITDYPSADLSQRDVGFAARRLVDAELKRFTRHDWDPLRGIRNQSLSTYACVDPSLYAAALNDAPALISSLSFAEFTRQARPGDILEHLAGVQPSQGARVEIVAISSRRLTTREAGGAGDARPSRVPIQGGGVLRQRRGPNLLSSQRLRFSGRLQPNALDEGGLNDGRVRLRAFRRNLAAAARRSDLAGGC